MWLIIWKSLYFFLPAYFANMAPVLFKKLNLLNKPVHEKLFGKNKTWRGLVVAVILGGIIFWLQKIAYIKGFKSLAIINYADFSIMFGFMLGFGAIMGDLVKSYYKRKAEIPPGKPWPVFDQIDFVIGGIIGSFFFYVPPAEVFLVLMVASPLLHLVVNRIGYWLGISKAKY